MGIIGDPYEIFSCDSQQRFRTKGLIHRIKSQRAWSDTRDTC